MQLSDWSFWIGIAIGVVLGFGAGLCLFLPIVWRQTDLEDRLDERKAELKAMIKTIERVRDRLDEMSVKRDREALHFYRSNLRG
jgi:hypothetical protein